VRARTRSAAIISDVFVANGRIEVEIDHGYRASAIALRVSADGRRLLSRENPSAETGIMIRVAIIYGSRLERRLISRAEVVEDTLTARDGDD